ncbi:hypothetical protein V1511DRAFT_493323 [Dipodascopsis uninucleata]
MASASPFKVRAVYEYLSDHPDDLSFPVDQVITVTEEEDEEWLHGRYFDKNGTLKEGMFPRNFVEVIVEEEGPKVPAHPSRPRPQSTVIAASPTSAAVTVSASSTTPVYEKLASQSNSSTASATRFEASQKELETEQGGYESDIETQSESLAIASKTTSAPAPVPAVVPTLSTMTSAPAHTSAPGHTSAPSREQPATPADTDKPSVRSSFKDRIAAFNTANAAPIIPSAKPQPTSFVKKPFVAPAPSSYIPPVPSTPKPKPAYDTEASPRTSLDEETAPVDDSHSVQEPIVTGGSLKDRIALLQQMQLKQQQQAAKTAKKKTKKKPTDPVSDEMSGSRADVEDIADDMQSRRSAEQRRGAPELSQPFEDDTVATEEEAYADDEETPIPSEAAEDLARRSTDSVRADIRRSFDRAGPVEARRESLESRESRSEGRFSGEYDDRDGTVVQREEPPNEEDDGDEEEDEEEEIDPEVARRLAIRERMAKMSGGMGMPFALPGVMGMPMGMPMGGGIPKPAAKKEKPQPDEPAQEEVKPVPILPILAPPVVPTMNENNEEEYDDEEQQEKVEKEAEVQGISTTREAAAYNKFVEEDSDVENDSATPRLEKRVSLDYPSVEMQEPAAVTHLSQEVDDISLKDQASTSAVSRPLPIQRSVPPPIPASAPVPSTTAPVPANRARERENKYGAEEDNDDEPELVSPVSPSRSSKVNMPRIPATPPASSATQTMSMNKSATFPTTAVAPPIPSIPPPVPTHSRPYSYVEPSSPTASNVSGNTFPSPPPPVPAHGPISPSASPIRRSMDMSDYATPQKTSEYINSDSEVTGYEADDDTDVNASITFDSEYHLSPQVPPPGIPPQPPVHRLPQLPTELPPVPTSMPPVPSLAHYIPEMPRAPPPPPAAPNAITSSKQQSFESRRSMDVGNVRSSFDTRMSSDVRRSIDRPRASVDSPYMATSIDMAESSLWWTKPDGVPPALESRPRDLIYEIDETSHTRRGKSVVMRTVYVLYSDYSQSIIKVQYDRENPSKVRIEQEHEAPPPQLRQDQLEDIYRRFGPKVRDAAVELNGKSVGDGDSFALVKHILSKIPDALQSAGTRSHGALVYVNLANASVSQTDEIKAGDIISFKNARFQGHKGSLHQKYSVDVGKPDHVAVVLEWDGTKRKVKVIEQNKEKGRVRSESYRLGDLRSGEVRVFRVVGRDYVGWDSD